MDRRELLGSLRFACYAALVSCVGVVGHFLATRDAAVLAAQPREVYGYALLMALVSTVIPIVLTVFLVWLGAAIHNCSLTVSDDKLSAHGPLYGRDIDKKSLKLDQAKMVSVETGELRPSRRSNGVGLSDLKLGWFKLENGEKALVFVSDAKRVVYIPTTEGYSLLLSPQDPDGFLNALRKN